MLNLFKTYVQNFYAKFKNYKQEFFKKVTMS